MQRLTDSQAIKLIKLVEANPVLYDNRRTEIVGNTRNAKDKTWLKVAAQLRQDVNVCKLAWKSMRDQVRKSMKLQKEGKERGHYKYYNQLQFLINYMQRDFADNEESSEREALYSVIEDEDSSNSPPHDKIGNNIMIELGKEELPIDDYSLGEETSENKISIVEPEEKFFEFNTHTIEAPPPAKRKKLMEQKTTTITAASDSSAPRHTNDAVDFFFLNMSAIVKQYNLNLSDLTRLQCRIFNFLTAQLEKCKNP